MTGQIPDRFHYEGEEYDLVGLDGGPLYEPVDFGITTQMASTACWRGYQMVYDCTDGAVILDQMYTRTSDKISVNGIVPQEPEKEDGYSFFNTIYKNLGLKTKFTGSILLAKDFISEMYVHMGFQSPDSYRTVIEVHAIDGDIVEVKDLSDEMEKRRRTGRVAPNMPDSDEDADLNDWINDRFSLDYKSD